MDITGLLRETKERKASDLHVRAGGTSVFRIQGDLVPIEGKMFSPEETLSIAHSLMNENQKSVFSKRHEVDLAYTFEGVGRFRVNVYSQQGAVNLAFRLVPIDVPSIEELNLPAVISQIAENKRGLILVTGTTGCGKSSTLAAIINHINTTHSANIITIEDPIEYIHKDKKSIISQRELGFDTLSYPDALKHVVRQDPDVILLGEMRDIDTMTAAIKAAQTGHLVLSTIHTVDASQSVNRIVDMFPQHQQAQIRSHIADTLKAIISQRLLPSADGTGRIPAVEIMIVTALMKKMIEDNNTGEILNLMKQGQYYGMQTFNQALISLEKSGKIKLEDALNAASNPEELMLAVRGIQSSTDDASSYM